MILYDCLKNIKSWTPVKQIYKRLNDIISFIYEGYLRFLLMCLTNFIKICSINKKLFLLENNF